MDLACFLTAGSFGKNLTDQRDMQIDAERFHTFVDGALLEISKRDDGFLSLFPVGLPDPQGFARGRGAELRLPVMSAETMVSVLEEGNAYLGGRYRTRCSQDGTFFADWIATVLIDAYQAAGEYLSLEPAGEPLRPVRQAFAEDYEFRRTAGGGGYHIRRSGRIPMVLVNATGLPIETWQSLLADPGHDYRMIVPVRSHGDLFAGGVLEAISLESEADEIMSIVGHEAATGVHILAWCNGARLAVEVAARLGLQASSLTLLAPMFKGVPGIRRPLTPYLRDLQMILDLVGRTPDMADMLASKIRGTADPFDWSKVAEDDVEQRDGIFRLPSRQHLKGLLMPLISARSLINISRRVASDERHPTLERLRSIRCPIMVMLGTHDAIVCNETTIDVMRMAECEVRIFSLAGAGHDFHDLQYHYLRHALRHFVDRGMAPVQSARFRRMDTGAGLPLSLSS